MITLYEDQQQTVELLRQSMRRNKRVLLQSETGSGKSIMSAYMINSALSKGLRCAFVIPRKLLLEQMSKTFDDFNIHHSFLADGKPFNKHAKVHLCTVGTYVNRLSWIVPDIVFIDESHYGAGQLDKINQYLTLHNIWVVGLTATPDNKNLHKWYDDMVCGLSMKQLIAKKRLSDYRYFAPDEIDLSGLKKSGDDYSKSQVDEFMFEKRQIVGNAVEAYKKSANGKKNMTFCTSVKNSIMTSETFNNAGVPSVHMDADTPDHIRKKMARDLAKGIIKNICSVDLLLFGYDLASASGDKNAVVESMTDLRPTLSRNVQRQKIGRTMRYKDYPAIINDHVNNHYEHGFPDDDVEWRLEPPEEKKRSDTERTPATRQCQDCYAIFPPAPVCPDCGAEYKMKPRDIKQVEGELKEIERQEQEKTRKKERQAQGRAQTLDDLIAIGKAKGYKNPKFWAQKVYNGRKSK